VREPRLLCKSIPTVGTLGVPWNKLTIRNYTAGDHQKPQLFSEVINLVVVGPVGEEDAGYELESHREAHDGYCGDVYKSPV
jgi:hypothetical protein